MGVQTKKKTINGREYIVSQLGAKQGFHVLARLTRMFGPTFAVGAEALVSQGRGLASIIETLVRDVSEPDLDFLVETFGPVTLVRVDKDHTPTIESVFDEHFAGRYAELFQWLEFCIEVNYADFLGELRARVAAAFARLKEKVPSRSPSASTGESIGSRAAGDTATASSTSNASGA